MRWRGKGKRGTPKRVFVGLLLCSVMGLLLPRSLTGRLMNLLQVLVPPQDAANRSVDTVGTLLVGVWNPSVPAEEYQQVKVQNQALRHTVASLQAEVNALKQSVGELSGLRARGLRGKLIPARVVAPDILAWRESQLINAGSLRGVRPEAAVVSNHFAVNSGTHDGIRNGQAVLAAEVFVGTVETAATHTARVRLLSDPSTRLVVLIARDQGDSFLPLDEKFWLVGAGDHRARVADVDHRYIKNGAIKVGDWVLTPPGEERLPVSVVIGSVRSVTPDPENPLLYILEVEPAIQPKKLQRVYVVNTTGE